VTFGVGVTVGVTTVGITVGVILIVGVGNGIVVGLGIGVTLLQNGKHGGNVGMTGIVGQLTAPTINNGKIDLNNITLTPHRAKSN
jgi:hypothetical protein